VNTDIGSLRFEFGRHETFTPRYGWLGKGLARAAARYEGFTPDTATADALGLGSRMAKSLAYWLEAGGIACWVKQPGPNNGKSIRCLIPSETGRVLLETDPYLEYPAAWWFIHIALAMRSNSITGWFFCTWQESAFTRPGCLDAFTSHLRNHSANQPAAETAQRDVACILQTYATGYGNEQPDPEDPALSPLADLSLLVRHAATGRYERTSPGMTVPPEAFLASASILANGEGSIALSRLAAAGIGPGRVFQLSSEETNEHAMRAAAAYRPLGAAVSLLGGELHLQIPAGSTADWLRRFYSRKGAKS
jgi:hypothetical protein